MLNQLLQISWVNGVQNIEHPVSVYLLLLAPFVWQILGESYIFSHLQREVLQGKLLQAGDINMLHLRDMQELLLPSKYSLIEISVKV